MKYRTLGKTGIRISELFLGAMIFGDERPDEACNGRSRDVPHAGHLCRTRNTPDLWRIGGGVDRVRVGQVAPGRKAKNRVRTRRR